jgi:hypothetical protein
VLYRLASLSLFVLILWGVTPLHAQDNLWMVEFDVGMTSVYGTSRDTVSGDDLAFLPHTPTVLSLRAARRVGPVFLGIVGSFGQAAVELGGPDLLLVDYTIRFKFYEIAPVIGFRLTGLGSNAAVTLNAGPVFSRWTLTDQPDRTRIGGRAGVAVPVWLGSHLGGAVNLDAIFTPSVFEEDELPAEFVRATTWRVQLSLGMVAGW